MERRRTSIRFTDQTIDRSASIGEHAAVHDTIVGRDVEGARIAMTRRIQELLKKIK